jgi:uncharacterized membrane protein YraQ (UPF0718 family)
MFIIGLYILTGALLLASFAASNEKSIMALKKSWKSLENIMPQFLSIMLIIGIALAILSPQDISRLIGQQSGWFGVTLAAVIGSITLIPGFVAFPLTAALLKNGGGLMQIAAFISALMAVGVVTLPIEIEYFGLKVPIIRNALFFAFSFIVAVLMGVILT